MMTRNNNSCRTPYTNTDCLILHSHCVNNAYSHQTYHVPQFYQTWIKTPFVISHLFCRMKTCTLAPTWLCINRKWRHYTSRTHTLIRGNTRKRKLWDKHGVYFDTKVRADCRSISPYQYVATSSCPANVKALRNIKPNVCISVFVVLMLHLTHSIK